MGHLCAAWPVSTGSVAVVRQCFLMLHSAHRGPLCCITRTQLLRVYADPHAHPHCEKHQHRPPLKGHKAPAGQGTPKDTRASIMASRNRSHGDHKAAAGQTSGRCPVHQKGMNYESWHHALLTSSADSPTYMNPAITPATQLAQGVMNPSDAVPVTRPDSSPLQHVRRSKVPCRKASAIRAVQPPQAAVRVMLRATRLTVGSGAPMYRYLHGAVICMQRVGFEACACEVWAVNGWDC